MGGDAKCVQHKIVLPMYVSYTSIPTSTANTTMKSTKLLTNPYLDVTTTNSTSAATCNPDKKSINDHNNKSTTNNRNTINNINKINSRCNANAEINKKININTNSDNANIIPEKYVTNFFSMSYNPYTNGSNIENNDDHTVTKKIMTNPMRTHNTDHVHRQYNNNNIIYRNSNKLCSVGHGYRSRSIRCSDSDDTRSSSIDYNFNYVKFRSPLSAACKASNYRDSSTTSTLATDCSLFARPISKHIDEDEKKQSFVFPKVHNHPNCQCGIQNCCPFANDRFENHVSHHRSHGICNKIDRKCYVSGYPHRRRDLNTNNAFNNDQKINESPPEYDQVDEFLMKRTFSHDRLFCQRSTLTARHRTRPKSYCNNISYCPTQL